MRGCRNEFPSVRRESSPRLGRWYTSFCLVLGSAKVAVHTAFAVALAKERLPLTSAPPDVLEHLVASRPENIHDRAWLVMFYSVTLSRVPFIGPPDEATKARLKSNLWLAFNDARLLLEPKISSVQALVILACYAEEFMTPSISWSLVSKACTML